MTPGTRNPAPGRYTLARLNGLESESTLAIALMVKVAVISPSLLKSRNEFLRFRNPPSIRVVTIARPKKKSQSGLRSSRLLPLIKLVYFFRCSGGGEQRKSRASSRCIG